MMRQKLAFVVFGPPSVWLRRMNGFSPVRITRLGSAGIADTSLRTGRKTMLGRGPPHRYTDARAPGRASQYKTGRAAACNPVEAITTPAIERSYRIPSRTLPANQATP